MALANGKGKGRGSNEHPRELRRGSLLKRKPPALGLLTKPEALCIKPIKHYALRIKHQAAQRPAPVI
jgi:hypothetical protein